MLATIIVIDIEPWQLLSSSWTVLFCKTLALELYHAQKNNQDSISVHSTDILMLFHLQYLSVCLLVLGILVNLHLLSLNPSTGHENHRSSPLVLYYVLLWDTPAFCPIWCSLLLKPLEILSQLFSCGKRISSILVTFNLWCTQTLWWIQKFLGSPEFIKYLDLTPL